MTFQIMTRGTGMKGDKFGSFKSSEEGKRISRKPDWVVGWWDNIGPEPIYIRDKHHLKAECDKHGVMPKTFMKRKSQGKGWEWSF